MATPSVRQTICFETVARCRAALPLRLLYALVPASAFPSVTFAQTPRGDGRVVVAGEVIDSNGRPITDAVVRPVGDTGAVETTTQGRFRIALHPGAHLLHIRAIGFLSVVHPVIIDSSDTDIGKLTMARLEDGEAVQLPDVALEVESSPAYMTRAVGMGFVHRGRLGFGTFRTRADFADLTPLFVADILRSIPGIRLVYGSNGPRVYFARCAERVGVWLNGFRIRATDHNEALALIHPREVAAIEVYRGVAQIPGEYREDSCAAIVIWTP